MPVGRAWYLDNIREEIDYKRMREVTWDDYKHSAIPLEEWCVFYETPYGEEAIICTWWQRVNKKSHAVWLFLKALPRLGYQNPPRSLERIGFGGPGYWVKTIPDEVARDSLNALSNFYPSWLERHWKPLVGGTVGAILLGVVIKKAR